MVIKARHRLEENLRQFVAAESIQHKIDEDLPDDLRLVLNEAEWARVDRIALGALMLVEGFEREEARNAPPEKKTSRKGAA